MKRRPLISNFRAHRTPTDLETARLKQNLTNLDYDKEFLPDFCNGWVIFNVMVLAELLALVISIVSQRLSTSIFKDLFLISLFVQWIGLASAASLCMSRKYLNRLPPIRAVAMAYLLLLCVAWVIGELTVWLVWVAGMTGSPRPDWYLSFHIQNLTISAIVDALALRYFLARHQLKRSALAEANAKMEVLKYRIRPHFLFNSMNIIASLTRRAPAKAEAAVEDMADVFRLMLDEAKNLVSVTNEIAVAKKYLALEKLRLERRLNVSWEIGDIPRTAKMPVLMLQLLLENAIYFGIEPSPEGGEITIKIAIRDNTLELSIGNPIPGEKGEQEQHDSEALANIRQRLTGHYGEAATLDVAQVNSRFVVDVKLPAFGGME